MPSKIMIIRHAEKPADDGSIDGVSVSGAQDAEDLIVRGWQRSGALARFFAPVNGPPADPRLATPVFIFASAIGSHSNSLRPQHTVLELANLLGQQLILTHAKGDEAELVADVLGRDGAVLIAWEHEAIPDIANQILGDQTTCPQVWPGSRFDVVWIFDPKPGSAGWTFSQASQLLLTGDLAATL